MNDVDAFHKVVGGASCLQDLKDKDLWEAVSSLKTRSVDESSLPFAKNRYPFQHLSDEIVFDCIRNTLCLDRKIGRMSDLIRNVLGINFIKGSGVESFVESHIDLTSATIELESYLVRMGYEPDDFTELYPECYKKHFTLKASIDDGRGKRFRELRKHVEIASNYAFKHIQSLPSVSGFVENEIYTKKYKKKYNHDMAVIYSKTDFPQILRSFEVQEIPNKVSDQTGEIVTVYTEKIADIHIKVGEGYPEFENDLVAAGFYSIKSEAGNTIYTGQYVSMSDAKKCFQELDDLFDKSSLAMSLILEICTSIRRTSKRLKNGEIEYSDIPHVLVMNESLA